MLSEEKKAINNLFHLQHINTYLDLHKKESFKIKNKTIIKWSQSVEILLNLITKLQKENEHWKNKFEKELEDNRKNSCELLKQDLVIREKNKQIDLMSEYIYNTQMECNIYYKDKEEVKNKFAKM